jgi:TRAP-type C4-dicarboxylate transport system permease small subunit
MSQKIDIKHYLKNLDVVIAIVALITLILLTSLGVVMRYLVGKPFTWLEEVQLFCMVWIVFAASGYAFRIGGQVAIEMLVESMPLKVQKIVEYFIDAVVFFVIGYFLYQSVGFVQLFIRSGRSTNMLRIPYWFIYAIAPLSCVDMLISYVLTKYFNKKNNDEMENIA